MTIWRVKFISDRLGANIKDVDYGVVVADSAEEAIEVITDRYGYLAGKAWFKTRLIVEAEQ